MGPLSYWTGDEWRWTLKSNGTCSSIQVIPPPKPKDAQPSATPPWAVCD